MIRLENNELVNIYGGGWTAAMVNAILSVGKFIFSTGQSLGSSIRRIGSNNLCPIR